MKIDHKRIFTADLYEVTNSTAPNASDLEIGGDVFGGYTYEEHKLNKGIVVVYFNDKVGYVPVWHLRNALQYISAKINTDGNDGRFLKTEPKFLAQNGELFIKNIKPLFKYPGQATLQQLIGIQKIQNDRDDTYSGGLELML